jgi:aspartyl/asparaginyl-tRNA synthetase
MAMIDPVRYHKAVSLLRDFFLAKNFVEVPAQDRTSILAACEDPSTIGSYNWRGTQWPLPQTGQMWLEVELLKNPELPGLFCTTTSYRNEPNPQPGRHETIFPMFEFETHGSFEDMLELERELVDYLGFGSAGSIPQGRWDDMANRYHVEDIDSETELRIGQEFGPAFLLTHFPYKTSPFWNMKKSGDVAQKCDVLLHGVETIGSAERSCNVEEMRHLFHTISNGAYAKTLFDTFGKERVEKELEEFLNLDFFPRFGGGIGVTRMIRALELQGQIDGNWNSPFAASKAA